MNHNRSDAMSGLESSSFEPNPSITYIPTPATEKLKSQRSGPSHPKRAEYLIASHVLVKNKEFQLAQNLLREILQVDSKDGQAIRALAQALAGQKRLNDAEVFLRILVQLDDRSEHLIDLADCLYARCNDSDALKYYLMALRTLEGGSPYLFEIYKNIGNIFVRSHDFDSAEENYNKAYTLNPKSSALFVNFGTLEIQKKNLDRATEHFRRAVELEPDNDRAWVGLAIVHREFGDVALSWGNLEKALDINPENDTALQLGLSWSVKDGRCPQMISHLQRYMEICGEDDSMSLALSQMYYIQGRFSEAAVEVERTLALDPHKSGAVELLALLRQEERRG